MIQIMRLAENDEFETYESISKINGILKIKWELIKGIVRLAKNNDFKAFESILQIGRPAGRKE